MKTPGTSSPETTRGSEHPAFGGILLSVVVMSGIALSLVVWWVSALVIDAWLRRRRPRKSLLERSQPYQPTSVAEEAQRWLNEQQESEW